MSRLAVLALVCFILGGPGAGAARPTLYVWPGFEPKSDANYAQLFGWTAFRMK
jgi:hypothetical protein